MTEKSKGLKQVAGGERFSNNVVEPNSGFLDKRGQERTFWWLWWVHHWWVAYRRWMVWGMVGVWCSGGWGCNSAGWGSHRSRPDHVFEHVVHLLLAPGRLRLGQNWEESN